MPSPLEACASSEPVNPAPSSPQPPASSARSRPWIEHWKPKCIICAYDADGAGDSAAVRLAVSDPRVSRLRPRGARSTKRRIATIQQSANPTINY